MSFNEDGDALMRGMYRVFSSAEIRAIPPMKEVIKGVFPQKGVGVIYGEPEGGKSFVALDMASCIAEGREWFGHKVIRSSVVYIVLEGLAGFSKRVAAWEHHNGRKMPPGVSFITGERVRGSDLMPGFNIASAADVSNIHLSVSAAGSGGGVVFIDTLSRASQGTDENGSEGMGAIVGGLHLLQKLLDCLIIGIHHPGKDLTRGMRGHSSLLGSLDASLEVLHTKEVRSWQPGKNKDNGKAAPEGFDLVTVDLGLDGDGDPITSCVVMPTGVASTEVHPKPKGVWQRLVFSVLEMMVVSKGDIFIEPLSSGAPSVFQDDLIDACIKAEPNNNPRAREAIKKAMAAMMRTQILGGTYMRVWFKV